MAYLKVTMAIFLCAILLCLSSPVVAADSKNILNLFIWSEYIDPSVIADFEKKFNATVKLDFYESNEEMIVKLHSGRQGVYDLIVPSTYFIPALTSLDLLQPLDPSQLPNTKNIDPSFRNLSVDPDNIYTVPYQWGTSGLVLRTKDISKIDPSWDLLFGATGNVGNFLLFDTARDALCGALKYLGYSTNTTDLKEIEAAGDLLTLTKKKPTFMGFDSGVGGLSKVMGGVATIAQVYSGEAIKASIEDPDVHYIIPKEGCEIWLDLLAIPKGAPNPKLAHSFLNYIMEPEVAAKLATFNSYATPNLKAMDFISEEDKNNPGMYPPPELLKKMEYMKDLGAANRIYDETWTLIKSR
jgi:spermidine/putrescine transport system substrate-binding protein